MGERVVLVDFDGTLAARPGLWGGCVLELLDELAPGHPVTLDEVRLGLKGGFPWHRAHEPHLHLCDSHAWWRPVTELIARTLTDAGLDHGLATRVATATPERLADASRGWILFDDTIPALQLLAEAGWPAVVLSNHVPELGSIVEGLGLAEHVRCVLSSAVIGYEKPHPEAFRIALAASGHPETAWMVGDNPIADVEGAERAGLPAILVRSSGEATYRAADLLDAAAVILGSDGG
jgi:putative hydrolase of the HAD superfamily